MEQWELEENIMAILLAKNIPFGKRDKLQKQIIKKILKATKKYVIYQEVITDRDVYDYFRVRVFNSKKKAKKHIKRLEAIKQEPKGSRFYKPPPKYFIRKEYE